MQNLRGVKIWKYILFFFQYLTYKQWNVLKQNEKRKTIFDSFRQSIADKFYEFCWKLSSYFIYMKRQSVWY